MSKEVNYTEDQVQTMLDRGTIRNEDAVELAAEFGKTVRSVRAKAVNMGIYVAKQRQSTNGGPIETKEDIAAEIGDLVGRNMEGLEKAPKVQLQFLRDFVKTA